VQVFVEPLREHRFVLILRGEGLGDAVSDTDPQAENMPPLSAQGSDPAGVRTAAAINRFTAAALRRLADHAPANGVTLRGFARSPAITPIAEITGLRAAALAIYPMYKGLARLVGMDVLDAGSTLGDQLAALQDHWDEYDFFYLHYKYTDSAGEDGHFAAKVKMIERLDAELPQVRALNPDVLVVTGDHSTPSLLQSHSWHPVPVVLAAPTCRPDGVTEFGESYCLRGGLGQMQAKYLLPLLLAHAGRLSRYGA
jgi:2,3-bisphosphoglycerate-independent phosphoglycerate mutase